MHAETQIDALLIVAYLSDLLESGFLQGHIDGDAQDLAYLWLEVNHPCEQ